jgi:hypothetical protein
MCLSHKGNKMSAVVTTVSNSTLTELRLISNDRTISTQYFENATQLSNTLNKLSLDRIEYEEMTI